jgi:hypothetical protein
MKDSILSCVVCLFTALLFSSLSYAEYFDVNDVLIQGDSTLMGMKIEGSFFAEKAFLIETTGARFEFVKNNIKIYQGLDIYDRRLLATLFFENEPNFIKVESNEDHILFWEKDLNIGIYGDSTLIISPKQDQSFKVDGNFKPDFEGQYKGEILLIDDKGGMEVYPQRYEAGYEITKLELGKVNWIAHYELTAGERVMVAAFPGRAFDWDFSFRCNTVFTCGSTGLGYGNPYGQMPSDETIEAWSKNFNICAMFFFGFYEKNPTFGTARPDGPYIVANKSEFKRFITTAHNNNLKVIAYCSLYYFVQKNGNFDLFFNQIEALKKDFHIDGVYIDGLACDNEGNKIDNKIMNWEMVRRFRELFKSSGVIYYHGTVLNSEVAPMPNVESNCDLVLFGENVPFESLNDPYINYQVKKYGISNTVATWKRGKHPNSITEKDIIDKILLMNGRERWGGYIKTKTPPENNKYKWPEWLYGEYPYYLNKYNNLKKHYIKNDK